MKKIQRYSEIYDSILLFAKSNKSERKIQINNLNIIPEIENFIKRAKTKKEFSDIKFKIIESENISRKYIIGTKPGMWYCGSGCCEYPIDINICKQMPVKHLFLKK